MLFIISDSLFSVWFKYSVNRDLLTYYYCIIRFKSTVCFFVNLKIYTHKYIYEDLLSLKPVY